MLDLDSLSGAEFEMLITKLLEKMGYKNVFNRILIGDGGIDIEADEYGKMHINRIAIQCKKKIQGSIGRPVVQKLDSAVKMEGYNMGMIVTTSNFSSLAREYANKLSPPIILVDGNTVEYLIKKYLYKNPKAHSKSSEDKDLFQNFLHIQPKPHSIEEPEINQKVKKLPSFSELPETGETCEYCSTILKGRIRYCSTCDWPFGPSEKRGTSNIHVWQPIEDREERMRSIDEDVCPDCGNELIGSQKKCLQCNWSFA